MQHLTRDELLRLLRAARADSERDWLLLLTAFWHGLRASEVTGLRTDAIKDGYITVVRLKGSLKTTQPLVADEDPLLSEKEALEDLVRSTVPGARLFPLSRFQLYRIVRRHGKTAEIPAHKLHPHILKHTIAMMSRSAGIENLRQYLGHKSLSSTGAYLRVDDETASSAVREATKGRKP